MRRHAEAFFGHVQAIAGADRPPFVKDELEASLECGILDCCLLWLRCGDCSHGNPVAFSCTRRRFCASDGARRTTRTAANLVDHVNLAQQGAATAKEVKALIPASVARVDQGTTLVDQAGSTVNEVVSAFRRGADIVGEISSASAEHFTGVAQVGQAVTQMDKPTQENAALAKQSAAAAENLKRQAQQLVQAASALKLRRA